jgi:hypothetical protein
MRNGKLRWGRIAAVVLAAGTWLATPAMAAELAASTAKEIGGHLTAAFITATEVAFEVEGLVGKKAPASLKQGLQVLDEAAAAAERLSNQHPNLTLGIQHVRRNGAAVVGSDGKVAAGALSRMHESVAELRALIINASILEAMANLKSAGDALDGKRAADVVHYLKRAEAALQDANEKGGYHIQNDVEEIQAALADIGDRVSAKVPVPRSAIDERYQEVQAHLFEVSPSD